MTLSWTFTAAAIALLICAALHDLAVRTVPNLLSASIMVLGLSLRLIDHSLLESLGVACFCFMVLTLLWRAGFIGGGDGEFGALVGDAHVGVGQRVGARRTGKPNSRFSTGYCWGAAFSPSYIFRCAL